MNLIQMYTAGFTSLARRGSDYSWLQRTVLRASHPVSIVFYIIGWTWGIFYLWHQNWILALIAVVMARAFGMIAARHAHLQEMANTTLGRLALLHLQPLNLAIQGIGAVVLITAVWMHSTELVLVGVSLIAAGHAFGWSNVHPSLALDWGPKKFYSDPGPFGS